MNRYIDNEIILNRKIGSLVYVYIMIIIVILLSLIIFLILFRYRTYYRLKGTVIYEDNHYYIKIFIPLDDMKYIIDDDIVIIDNKNYKYKIISIDEEYFTDNIITFQILKIEIDMLDEYKFNNLNLDLKFIKEDKKGIDYILMKK